MKQFQKNVLRMALENKGSFIGAVCIIAIGIFVYVALIDTLENLQNQVDVYYENAAMADVFAEVSGISETVLEGLEEIPGIREASGKMTADMRLLGSGQEEIVTVHLMSYKEDAALNKIELSESAPEKEELFLGVKMEDVYGYEIGEPLQILWQGETYDLTYAGTCQAPDYVYSIPPGGAMIPDGEVYDIACITESKMEEILGRRGFYNELGFRLESGYRYEDVKEQLKEALEPYGLMSISDRSNQASCSMVESEMGELVSIGTILPALFMAISVFMLYVVLKKMIDRDQRLIGTMKAFGMTDREMMGGYLVEGAAAGAIGAIVGSVLAIPFGRFMFSIYVEFFNLPDTVYHNYMESRVIGFVVAVATALLAVYLGVKDILTITPAQAMRTKPPAETSKSLIPNGILKHLGSLERMACRSIVRNPFRGFLIVLAIAFPFAMSSILFSFDGIVEQMFFDQFEKIQVYDLQLSLDGFTNPLRATQAGEQLDGVKDAEAVCMLAAELTNENISEHVVLYGLNPGSELWKIMDNRGTFYEPPDYGVIINSRTAKKLHVGIGSVLDVQCPGVTVDSVKIPVSQIIDESFGSSAYMSLEGIGASFPTEVPANTVLLTAEPGQKEVLKEQVRETSRVTWLVDTDKIIKSYRDMMESMIIMIYVLAVLSVVAGGILIYNISMINIRERITEFGTLMILGKSNAEIAYLVFVEQLIFFIAGIIMGIPGSLGVKWLVETLVMSDNYSVHMDLRPGAYLVAFVICLVITAAAWKAETNFIRKIHLTEILKERE